MMDTFVFDLKNKWLINITKTKASFIDAFEENIKDKKIKIIKNNVGEKLLLQMIKKL